MSRFISRDITTIKQVIESISELTGECLFTIKNNGIYIEGTDPSLISKVEFFLPANNLVKSTRRLQIEKYMDSFTDKELSLMESLASGINEARNIED